MHPSGSRRPPSTAARSRTPVVLSRKDRFHVRGLAVKLAAESATGDTGRDVRPGQRRLPQPGLTCDAGQRAQRELQPSHNQWTRPDLIVSADVSATARGRADERASTVFSARSAGDAEGSRYFAAGVARHPLAALTGTQPGQRGHRSCNGPSSASRRRSSRPPRHPARRSSASKSLLDRRDERAPAFGGRPPPTIRGRFGAVVGAAVARPGRATTGPRLALPLPCSSRATVGELNHRGTARASSVTPSPPG